MMLSQMQRDAIAQRDMAWLPLPLEMGSSPHSMAAHLRHTARLLRNRHLDSPCSEAMRHLTGLFERSVQPAQRLGLACRSGCAYCCKQPVTLLAPEAFFLASQIRGRSNQIAAMADAAHAFRGLAWDGRWHGALPCPLLEESACTAYSARPFSCRGFVSRDVDACRVFEQSGKPVAMLPDFVSVLYACRMILVAAIRLAGLKDEVFEMNAAATVALAGNDVERHWLQGKAVFKDLERGPQPPPQFEANIQKMIAFVAPTV
jgi:hypothetical protein